MTDMITAETVRLYGYVKPEDFAENSRPIRALLFGQLVERALPVVQEYISDLYHDVHWIDEHVNGEMTFEFLARHSGTNMGLPEDPANSARIGVQIGAGDAARFYRVRLFEERGMWRATFTQIPLDQVPRPGN